LGDGIGKEHIMGAISDLWIGLATLVVVCLLTIILGLDMKMNAWARRIEQKLDDAMKKLNSL